MTCIENIGLRHFLLGGDINAHNTLWGSDKICTNGQIISDNIDWENFVISNNKNPTHWTKLVM